MRLPSRYATLHRSCPRRGRVGAWIRSGEVMAELVRRHLRSREGLPASFMNDALIATSCRLEGVTLITRNERDFAAIAKVEPVSYVLPWPP